MRTVLAISTAILNPFEGLSNTDSRTPARRTAGPMISLPVESATEPIAAPPLDLPPEIRGEPPPLHGGLPTLLRFMRSKGMLNAKYARLLLRLGRRKLVLGRRLRLDGIAFIGPRCELEVGQKGTLELGRWSWIGHGSKIRSHEGTVSIGAKTVLGQECTISS